MPIQTFLAKERQRERGGEGWGEKENRAPSETKERSPLELFLLVCACSLFSFQPFWLNVFKHAYWGLLIFSDRFIAGDWTVFTESVGISEDVPLIM